VEARGPEGLREVLRGVLGFPDKDKAGPGNMLDPDQGRPELCFVLQFSDYVRRGDNPAEALSKACNDVLDIKIADKVSPPTLREWVKKHYDLKAFPRRIDEWRKIISQRITENPPRKQSHPCPESNSAELSLGALSGASYSYSCNFRKTPEQERIPMQDSHPKARQVSATRP